MIKNITLCVLSLIGTGCIIPELPDEKGRRMGCMQDSFAVYRNDPSRDPKRQWNPETSYDWVQYPGDEDKIGGPPTVIFRGASSRESLTEKQALDKLQKHPEFVAALQKCGFQKIQICSKYSCLKGQEETIPLSGQPKPYNEWQAGPQPAQPDPSQKRQAIKREYEEWIKRNEALDKAEEANRGKRENR
jgi:hypothetical protein